MPIERIAIDAFLTKAAHMPVLDVRSPGEYKHAHLPGAHSLPLFTDAERAVVGTAYKQQSREQAIKIGLDYFGPKMRRMVEEVEAVVQTFSITHIETATPKSICVYCWRGGMRSGAVAWLLGLYGFQVYALQGGYKRFRTWVFEKLAQPYQLRLVGGYTGSGKTELLHELERSGETIIDLEALASHKGSAFGNIGQPAQPSQEQFENGLALELHAKTSSSETDPNVFKSPCLLWVEDESQRIGSINIPTPFWNTMRSAPVSFLDIPFNERLQHLVTEYGCLNKTQMSDAIRRISKRLGPLETKNSIQFLEGGNTAESFRILLQYYDKQYRKALHNRENLANLLREVPCNTVTPENALLLKPITA